MIDAEQIALSMSQINAAFTSLDITGSGDAYLSITVPLEEIQSSTIVQVSEMFVILMSAEVDVDLHPVLETELLAKWVLKVDSKCYNTCI